MAKFKVGDKVTDGNSVFQITKVNPDDYGWKLVKGDGKDAFGKSISAGGMISWADQKMRKASNAVTSKNPVVANAIKAMNRSDYRGTFKVGQVVVMNPEAVRGMGYSGKVYSTVTKVFDGGKSALAFDGLEITGAEAGPISWYDPDDIKAMVKRGKIPYEVASKYFSASALNSASNAKVAKNAVDPLDALNSAETKMREAIGELGKVTDPDLRPLASRIATKLKAVQGELRRELAV